MRGIAAGLVLIAFGWGAVADAFTPKTPQTPQCAAGNTLLTASEFEAARQRYNKALDDEGAAGRTCGAEGLAGVTADENKAAEADKDLTWKKARAQAKDWWRGNDIWVWAVVGLWFALLAFYTLRRLGGWDNAVRVRAPASSADLAKGVVAAAHAAGDTHESSIKIYNASDETPDTTAADVAKVFRIPGTVPVGDLLKRPPFSGWLARRLDVSGAIAGGWGVIDVTYRRPFNRKRHERIAIDLGDSDDDEKSEVLALVGGAWLNAVLHHKDPSPVLDRDGEGLVAHALFRAGANRQTLGKTQIARACYDQMPKKVESDTAPFAWAGARLNQMMALKNEHRWLAAAQVANEVDDFPANLEIKLIKRFGPEQIKELLLRQRYMSTILRLDHWYAMKDHASTTSSDKDLLTAKAEEAIERLRKSLAEAKGEPPALCAAARMLILSYSVAARYERPQPRTVLARLGLGDLSTETRSEVGAAGYYDAACVMSLLLDSGVGEAMRLEYRRYGVWLLETAVAASPEGRRGRVKEMAKADPMLEHLEKADPAGFAKAIGDDPPPEEKPKETAVPFYFAGNGARSRSTASTSSS